MNEPRPKARTNAARRRQRAKRGLIAGYIHELSGRHSARRPVADDRIERPMEPPAVG